MNRKQAERKSEKWLDNAFIDYTRDSYEGTFKSLVSLLIRIDKAAYKRGVKDGYNEAVEDAKDEAGNDMRSME